jgi:hypothetical protein
MATRGEGIYAHLISAFWLFGFCLQFHAHAVFDIGARRQVQASRGRPRSVNLDTSTLISLANFSLSLELHQPVHHRIERDLLPHVLPLLLAESVEEGKVKTEIRGNLPNGEKLTQLFTLGPPSSAGSESQVVSLPRAGLLASV